MSTAPSGGSIVSFDSVGSRQRSTLKTQSQGPYCRNFREPGVTIRCVITSRQSPYMSISKNLARDRVYGRFDKLPYTTSLMSEVGFSYGSTVIPMLLYRRGLQRSCQISEMANTSSTQFLLHSVQVCKYTCNRRNGQPRDGGNTSYTSKKHWGTWYVQM